MANSSVKPYRDTFGNPLPKKDVELAAMVAARNATVTPFSLSRAIGHTGIIKARRLLTVLADAKVVKAGKDSTYSRIINNDDAAVNAALRQLKKGRKGEN